MTSLRLAFPDQQVNRMKDRGVFRRCHNDPYAKLNIQITLLWFLLLSSYAFYAQLYWTTRSCKPIRHNRYFLHVTIAPYCDSRTCSTDLSSVGPPFRRTGKVTFTKVKKLKPLIRTFMPNVKTLSYLYSIKHWQDRKAVLKPADQNFRTA
ncbi:hypothetical protein BC943DRAFT_30166 [Umbelopsis sp. AD052]|nr:hypothetical protein BC943DRAFT_30166 [Umbelopsis sp. AD052]